MTKINFTAQSVREEVTFKVNRCPRCRRSCENRFSHMPTKESTWCMKLNCKTTNQKKKHFILIFSGVRVLSYRLKELGWVGCVRCNIRISGIFKTMSCTVGNYYSIRTWLPRMLYESFLKSYPKLDRINHFHFECPITSTKAQRLTLPWRLHSWTKRTK